MSNGRRKNKLYNWLYKEGTVAVVVICQLILAFATKEACWAFIIYLKSMRQKLELQSNMCNSFGTNVSEASGDHMSAERKLEFILQCNNGITVVNKAGIWAPTMAFSEDSSLFPFQVGHHHLKKRTSTPTPPNSVATCVCIHLQNSLH